MAKKMGKAALDNVGRNAPKKGKDTIDNFGRPNLSTRSMPGQTNK